MDYETLKRIVLDASFEEEGKRKLTCSDAFRLAGEHDVPLLDISRVIRPWQIRRQEGLCQKPGHNSDVAAAHRIAPVGRRPGHRKVALHHVQPVHRAVFGGPASGKVAGVPHGGRVHHQEVAVEADNDIGL